MMVLQVDNVQKEYQGNPVLEGVSFHLAGGERLALVGPNGCGKTTLMKILAGQLGADGGSVLWVSERLSRAYLSQEEHWDPARNLREQMGPVPGELLARCQVTPEMLDRTAGALSGGQKVRAALARVLAGRPDLLLLDEPTNHLDADGLQWLESLLRSYRGTVLVVSHDRYFLDQVATRTLELQGGRARSYAGNYSAYAAAKQAEIERARADYDQYRSKKKQLEAALREMQQRAQWGHNVKVAPDAPISAKGFYATKGTAAARLARSMEKRLEKMHVDKPRDATVVNLRFEGAAHLGRNLVLAENLGFSFESAAAKGRRWVFRGAGFYVQRGDRVALVGPNGSGKTTLLRLLLGALEPSEGRIYRAPARIGYLAQEMETLDLRNTVLEEASGGNAAVDQADVRTLLGCLLFSRDDVWKRVGTLSGGEKLRLAIAKLLLSAPDLLVLDEPTNGLDLLARERVEEALDGYAGTLLLVSHDRYLLRRTANKILSVSGRAVQSFPGGYEEFLQRRTEPAKAQDGAAQRLLLETRLAQLSAALATASPEAVGALNEEFIRISRALRQGFSDHYRKET